MLAMEADQGKKTGRRSRTGKGRKERMKHKIEVLMSEMKESEKTEQLTRRNMALKRSVSHGSELQTTEREKRRI